MRQTAGIGLAFGVGAVAIAAPILISVRVAWRQSTAFEESRVTGYAQDALRRGNEIGADMNAAIRELSSAHFPPCSPQDIDAMRQLDVGSVYLQAVSRISGNTLTCTSLGTNNPVPLGPPTVTSGKDVRDWLNLRIPLSGGHPIAVVAKGNIALLINPELSLDTYTEGPDVSLALFFPSQNPPPRIIANRGPIRPDWYRNVPRGASLTFLSDGHVVSVARAAHGDLAAVAAAPDTYIQRQVRHFAFIFIPIGIICGLALAWAVFYISRAQMALPSVLRSAARRREFFLEYQPVVDMETGRWIGAEALVRWQRGGHVVMPDLFIPSAEESGVIRHITGCVAEMATEALSMLVPLDAEFCVSLNVSAADLRSGSIVELLQRMLREAGAQPRNLQIEATERGLLDGQEIGQLTHAIRAMGISVAIDDFGTGYSSLSRLETLAPDALKIDKSFVDAMGTNGATNQVVPHIIEMGRALGLKLVAEGVETKAQADSLRALGVRYAQGFFFAKPMPLKDLCNGVLARTIQGEVAPVARL